MMRYASQTSVPSERTKAEIETVIRKYGADQFISGWAEKAAVIGFRMKGKMVKFHLPLPSSDDKKYRYTETGRWRSPGKRADVAALRDHDQEVRQRWRALLLVIKAKMEAVSAGITTFEEEFLAHIVMADGKTVAQWAVPQIESMYQTGSMPPLLPGVGETSGTP
jgi:hypothetical protein